MNKPVAVMVVLVLALFLGGCYDYSEPDEKAWVLAVGLDQGKQNKLTVTVVIAVPKDIAGGGGGEPVSGSGGGGGGGFFTVSVEAPTLLSSLELLNAMVDRRVELSHTKWFVFSRELAEDDIGGYLAALVRFHQFRRTADILVCEGRAEELLVQGVPVLEDNVGKYYDLIMEGAQFTEFIPYDNFHEFYKKSSSPGVAAVAALAAPNLEGQIYPDNTTKSKGEYRAGRMPRRGGVKIEIMGGAVFKGGRMVGILDGNQVGIQKLFFGKLKRTIFDIHEPRDPDKFVVVDAKPRDKPEFKVQFENGYPRVAVDIKMEGSIISNQGGGGYNTPGTVPRLEEKLEEHIHSQIMKTFARSQEMDADFLGLGLHAKRLFLTWPEWEAYKWDEKFSRAELVVNIDFSIRRTGLIHDWVPLK